VLLEAAIEVALGGPDGERWLGHWSQLYNRHAP
jgi:hypothetical protein